ncbi:MAG: PAS domain S-box protein [Vicinamibacteria bacterium]|nr:PAS domain S-box protein [Vicinamibacteria bacterium]
MQHEKAWPHGRLSYKLLFERNPLPMWIFDRATLAFLAVNDAAVALYGHTREEFLRMSLLDVRTAEDVPSFLEAYEGAQKREAGPQLVDLGVFEHRAKDGSPIHVHLTRANVELRGRRAALVVVNDVGEILRITRAADESRRRFELFMKHLPGVAFVKDESGRYAYMNEFAAEVVGRSPEECLGRTDLELFPLGTAEQLRYSDHTTLEAGRPVQIVEATRGPAGEVTWLVTKFPIPTESGCRLGGIGIDITERVKAEQERERLVESERVARQRTELLLERLVALESVTESALTQLGLEDLIPELLSRLRTRLRVDATQLLLLDAERNELVVRGSVGFPGADPQGQRVPVGRGVAGRLATQSGALTVEDLGQVEVLLPALRRMRSAAGARLLLGDRVVGALLVACLEARRFESGDVELLQLVADRMAPAIDRARLLEETQESRTQLQLLTRRLVNAQEDERRSISRELHDEFGQIATALKLTLEALPQRGPEIDDALALVKQLLHQVRDLSMKLRPALLDTVGLLPALVWHLERFTRQTGIRVDLRGEVAEARLSAEVKIAAYRIVQEALTNVARHSQVRAAALGVDARDGNLVLLVEDGGAGFDAETVASRDSAGLLGMRERALALGGRLEVRSRPGAGTRVQAWLPIGGRD